MRLLILSCNTGQGHNSCAKAVQTYFERQGDTGVIIDALGFISEKASRFVSNWHSRLYRHAPAVFDKGYKYAQRHTDVIADDSALYKLLTSGASELNSFIREGNYDAVLCVHVFAALLMTRVLALYPQPIRTGLLSTDYTCSPGFENSGLDYCFIPDEALRYLFTDAGLPDERIITAGIPVRNAFWSREEKPAAKETCGIDPEHDHILMMCGSMGCGPIEELAVLLAEGMKPETELSIVCGTNEKLQRSLQKILQPYPNVHIHGFVTDISLMMDSADLFLTKPGGISVSEAAVKRLPMVLIDAVAGCESGNLQFFLDKGAAKTAQTPAELAKLCLQLLQNRSELSRMAAACEDFAGHDASAVIYQYMAR